MVQSNPTLDLEFCGISLCIYWQKDTPLVWRIVPPEASTCTGRQQKNAHTFPFPLKHLISLPQTLGIPRLRGYVVVIGYSTVMQEHHIFSIPSLRRNCWLVDRVVRRRATRPQWPMSMNRTVFVSKLLETRYLDSIWINRNCNVMCPSEWTEGCLRKLKEDIELFH